jgi:cytochrome b pre-mRNA-processing protein 3
LLISLTYTSYAECHLPPTFQSWFTITNLHVWLLTVRLRALPKPHGPEHIQGLIDHFFIDVEDRIRAVLQPGPTPPYTSASGFYINPNTAPESESESQAEPNADGNPRKPRGRAPDRLVSQQMKIFKEQWAGMGMSLDLGLIQGDADMAGAVWRNLLGARGARGIAFEPPSSSSQQHFRRSINLVGGKVENVAKVDARGLDVEEARDDGSGVHDFAWSEVDKYLRYPEVMVDVISYLRRELVRLERLSDEEVMSGELEKLKFGHIRQSPN